MRGVIVAGVAVLGLLSAEVAQATDYVSWPYPGVKRIRRKTSTISANALVINLCKQGVRVRATKSAERGRRTSSFGRGLGAAFAINGDFFSYDGYGTVGLAMGNGVRWPGSQDKSFETVTAFGPNRAELFDMTRITAPQDWMRQVVSGRAQIVKNGQVVESYDCSWGGDLCNRNPRTAVGFSQYRRKLYLAVVDGRECGGGSNGMTARQLGAFMKSLGAYDAVSMDGGGSSAMWMRGRGLVSDPSDASCTQERVVANHLAVFAGGDRPPRHCTPLPITLASTGDGMALDELEPLEDDTLGIDPALLDALLAEDATLDELEVLPEGEDLVDEDELEEGAGDEALEDETIEPEPPMALDADDEPALEGEAMGCAIGGHRGGASRWPGILLAVAVLLVGRRTARRP